MNTFRWAHVIGLVSVFLLLISGPRTLPPGKCPIQETYRIGLRFKAKGLVLRIDGAVSEEDYGIQMMVGQPFPVLNGSRHANSVFRRSYGRFNTFQSLKPIQVDCPNEHPSACTSWNTCGCCDRRLPFARGNRCYRRGPLTTGSYGNRRWLLLLQDHHPECGHWLLRSERSCRRLLSK